MKANHRKHTVVGHGGINCPCCCSKGAKPVYKRQAKRRFARVMDKLTKDILNETI